MSTGLRATAKCATRATLRAPDATGPHPCYGLPPALRSRGRHRRIRIKRIASAALLALACSTGAAAAELPLPSVTFTGEAKFCQVYEAQEFCTVTLAIFYTPDRWSHDMTAPHNRWIFIYDVNTKTATEIDFALKTYAVSKFDPATDESIAQFLPGRSIGVQVGQETVAGVPTTKYKFEFSKDAVRGESLFWVSALNIVMRAETAVTDTNSKSRMGAKMDVTKLTVGAFDPGLLEVAIPSDFKKKEN